MARTCVSGKVPDPGPAALMESVLALERGDVVDEFVELLRVLFPVRLERGHRGGGVHERARNRVAAQPVADGRQVRSQRAPVLSDLVAGEAAGRGRDLLAPLELRRRREIDLAWRAGERAENRQVGHR